MPALSFEQIREKLAARFGDAVGPAVEGKDPFVVVKAEKILDIGRFLHDDPELAFDYLIDETGVDYPKENLIRVVFHLWSMPQKHSFKFKIELDRANAKMASVDSIWHAANWLEREVFDLMGVTFEGHPDLRRIMMPDDWVGHPLRKDWQEAGGYGGISNVRVSPLAQLLELDKAARAEAAKNAPPAPAPVAEAPKAEAKPAADAAKAEAKPAAEAPKAEAQPAEAPKAEVKPAEAPKADAKTEPEKA